MKQLRLSFLAIAIACTLACSTGYHAVKTNRAQYQVNSGLIQDSTIIKMYLPYKHQMEAEMNTVIGKADFALVKKSDKPESLLGNFFSDACFEEAKKIDVSIDFAFPTTNGGLRSDLPKGNITLSNVFELMPFENELMVFELKGADVADLLDNIAAANSGQPIAGIRMKVVDKKAKDVYIGGAKFNKDISYRILTSDYIAGGGDNVWAFQKAINKKTIGLKVRDALINYIKDATAKGKTINAKLDGRITN